MKVNVLCRKNALLGLLALAYTSSAFAARPFDIRDRGAKGDGLALDTAAIQKSLDDCAASGGGMVVFPPGCYMSGTINLRSGVTLWTKPGNTVGKVTVSGFYRSSISVESWADAPITNVVIRNAQIEFAGGGTAAQAQQPVKGPGVDARSLPAWGLFARNVETITLEDVRFSLASDDLRPVLQADRVERLNLDNFRFTRVEGVTEPFVRTGVGKTTETK